MFLLLVYFSATGIFCSRRVQMLRLRLFLTAFAERCSFLHSAFTNFVLLPLVVRLGGRCKIFGGTLLPLKNMKFPDFFLLPGLIAKSGDQTKVVGRLGFEPRLSASKADDLPLVDRPVHPARFFERRYYSANIPFQYSGRGRVSVRMACVPLDWTRC